MPEGHPLDKCATSNQFLYLRDRECKVVFETLLYKLYLCCISQLVFYDLAKINSRERETLYSLRHGM